MEFLHIFGRILFGGFFAFNGLNHLMRSNMLTSYAASKGVPFPRMAVTLSGLLILAGGAGFVFNMYIQLSAILIAVFLVGVSFQMHKFWKDSNEMTNFMKNMALLGASLMFF